MEKYLKKLSSIDIASILLAISLISATFSMSYGFYTFVKLFATIVGCMWSYHFYREGKDMLLWISIISTILFQPFVKIALDKDTWTTIDLSLAVILIILISQRIKENVVEGEK